MNLDNYANMDPIMLFSLVNTKLRDDFDGDLEKLITFYDMDRQRLLDKLSSAGFEYLPDVGQFR
ncbi:DUF4250 domain-containing protein [Vibrio zhugei]|uniref:DUF4250 domain-containing protein n=1 Tax=Vibrio zhugei TaxID=2479546 RepID=A0ABV7C6R9_9VIBR|nr:DUF4250 domain-containing protein [Vibrio zhugei]